MLQRLKALWSTYKELSKSGIVALVLISVLGGYLAGQSLEMPLDWARLAATLLGILLLASGSSALNQLQEHKIDAQMPRTAGRPIPSGRVTPTQAVVFISISLALGLLILGRLDPQLLWLGVAAVASYNGLYTLWWKKRWAFAAVPGAVPGALPILMGYAAADGRVMTPGGLYLFFILLYWQMPHFWVLAIRYRDDYAAGGIPTLPVAQGNRPTVRQIVIWCVAYVALAMMAPMFFPVGALYLSIAALTSVFVLKELWSFAREPEGKSWLRFFLWVNFSLILYVAAICADLWRVVYLTGWIAR